MLFLSGTAIVHCLSTNSFDEYFILFLYFIGFTYINYNLNRFDPQY